jgi:7,8-dihydroneopterin aldolase/epimerase/oxygenase
MNGDENAVNGDRITLRGLRARGYHGVFDFEQRDGQEFVVDAVLWTDITAAAQADDLTRTAHYGELAKRLVAIVTGDPVKLIETLASRLADACLEDPAVSEAEITVHKPQAPIPFPFDDVAVTIRRGRT